jgi:hypothetical protein
VGVSYVNNEDIDAGSGWQTGDSPHRFCHCGETYSCKPSIQICCLDGTRDSGTHIIFVAARVGSAVGTGWRWEIGETCDYDKIGCNNISSGGSFMVSRYSPSCRNYYYMYWDRADPLSSDGDNHCEEVLFTLKYVVPGHVYTTTKRASRLWFLDPLVMDDPYYLWKNATYPDDYPLPCESITFNNCSIPVVYTGCSGSGGGGGDGDPDPECDTGCWQPCVLCPTPLSMYLVISQSPTCCLHGSWALTYTGGLSGYFYLPSSIGGPSGTCGQVTEFTMTCDGAGTVNFHIQYIDINGTTITRNTTVSAACSGGAFETAAFNIPGSVFFPELCEGGLFTGADIRVVSV